ncbi:binding-protein-dependent transport systems inner membrane protein, partial [Lacticaseibacillus paracasei subsp. paracasei Lpp126]
DFILLGIDRNNNAMTLIGAIASALLAIIFSGGIYWLQNTDCVTFWQHWG